MDLSDPAVKSHRSRRSGSRPAGDCGGSGDAAAAASAAVAVAAGCDDSFCAESFCAEIYEGPFILKDMKIIGIDRDLKVDC